MLIRQVDASDKPRWDRGGKMQGDDIIFPNLDMCLITLAVAKVINVICGDAI